MKNILIVSTQPQRFLDQLNVYHNIIKKSKGMQIKFFISNEVYSKYSHEIEKYNLQFINNPKRINNNQIKTKLKKIVKKIISKKFKENLLNLLNYMKTTVLFDKYLKSQEEKYSLFLENKYKEISILVKKNKISVILLNGDRHLGIEPIFIKISKEYKIPSIILYLTIFANEESIFRLQKRFPVVERHWWISKYVIDSQKKLSYKVIRNSYYYPHPIANALDKFGVLTSNPYVMGSGESNILCLANEHQKKLYVKDGVDEKKIRVLGDIAYDRLYSVFEQRCIIKDNVIDKYSLDKSKQIIIVALPQLAEHNLLSWKKHWKEIEFLMKNIDKLDQNILISLHPKMDIFQYMFLEQKYNCKILDERLSNVLPVADVFIATFSSTVIWSVLCGIKTIVVDFYNLNYSMYDFLTSIKKIDNKSIFLQEMEKYIDSDVDFSEDWKNLSKKEVFDGKTIDRYIKLIKEVTNNE